jgi:hypothetical protein
MRHASGHRARRSEPLHYEVVIERERALQFLGFPSVATNCARQKEKRARSANQIACQDGIYFLVRRFNRVSPCTAAGSEPTLKTEWQRRQL